MRYIRPPSVRYVDRLVSETTAKFISSLYQWLRLVSTLERFSFVKKFAVSNIFVTFFHLR